MFALRRTRLYRNPTRTRHTTHHVAPSHAIPLASVVSNIQRVDIVWTTQANSAGVGAVPMLTFLFSPPGRNVAPGVRSSSEVQMQPVRVSPGAIAPDDLMLSFDSHTRGTGTRAFCALDITLDRRKPPDGPRPGSRRQFPLLIDGGPQRRRSGIKHVFISFSLQISCWRNRQNLSWRRSPLPPHNFCAI